MRGWYDSQSKKTNNVFSRDVNVNDGNGISQMEEWMRGKPISMLKLDRSDRLVIMLAGNHFVLRRASCDT
jgi:hypothetical protein